MGSKAIKFDFEWRKKVKFNIAQTLESYIS